MTARGTLRIYLGAAPGVGKTYAMLEEGRRRAARGTDVVVALAETHGRPHTAERLAGLEVIARKQVSYRGTTFTEMDLDAVLARAPQLALVDELAHTIVPGAGAHSKRWQDVEALLEAGIDVISTVNVQHLESLNDVVQAITGVPQRETVPDSVVRAADQVELVDMTPEALRRRMAHGNVYPSEKIDAALDNYFRPGNLTALRELALLWLADEVDAGLHRYRQEHGITAAWETRERVVVALPGGPEGEPLIRRGARIASRGSGRELHAVHVARHDGLAAGATSALTEQRRLVESLGGTYHTVIGEDVARSLLDFARAVDATQVVLGASRRRPWVAAFTGPGTGATVTRLSGSIDVHMVSHDYVGHGWALPRLTGGLTVRRRLLGAAFGAGVLLAVTVVGISTRPQLGLASDALLYLLAVVVTAAIGGFWPALVTAVAGSLLLNYFFTPPIYTLAISAPENVVALLIFMAVTAIVSRLVDIAARRTSEARRAASEARTLADVALSMLKSDRLSDLLERVREIFRADGVCLLRRAGDAPASSGETAAWLRLAAVGSAVARSPAEATASAAVDEHLSLALSGRPLAADDQRLLAAIAAQVAIAYRQRELTEAAEAAAPLAASERARTALLNAVSHDLRTPIATAKTAVASLRADDVQWSPADQRELLATAEASLDHLTDLVTNLLDMSRLQAGLMPVLLGPVGLDDVVVRALGHLPESDRVDVEIPMELPAACADPGLLERVIANLVGNAIRYSPSDQRIRVAGSCHGEQVQLRVIDRGPGIDPRDAETVFEAFRRRDDRSANGNGVGLGLAIAQGFVEAMRGRITVEPTPGGGATLVVDLPIAMPDRSPATTGQP